MGTDLVEIAGSGRLRVASGKPRRRQSPSADAELGRDAFSSSPMNAKVSAFWDELRGVGFSPRLIERVWVANRCLQLNAQQIASMPLRFIGSQGQPAWLTNPDPNWFPNGIGSALSAIVRWLYKDGNAFIYVTAHYADGFPSAWTVLNSFAVNIKTENGQRVYETNGRRLDSRNMVHIIRDDEGQLRGSSALQSYADQMWGAVAGSATSLDVLTNPVPNAILKSLRKLTAEQAAGIQDQWQARTAARRGAPAILPPELDFETLAFSPKDLLLLDAQEFNTKVIASAFGVPAFMLNMPLEGGLVYQNPEILFDFWWRTELRHPAQWIGNALSAQMLARGNSVHVDPSGTLIPGLVDLHKVWYEAYQQGLITVEEYRRAVLQLGPLGDTSAINELLQPASAGASPADQPTAEIVTLRPAQVVSSP